MTLSFPENLYEVRLGYGTIKGIDLVESSKSGNARLETVPAGYDGIHLIGKGRGQTFIEGPYNSVICPSTVGKLRISGCTVREGVSTAVFTGTDSHNSPNEFRPMEFWADDCELGMGEQGRWVVFTNQCDVALFGVEGRGWVTGEHWNYPHAIGRRGIHWEGVTVHGAFNEIGKSTHRPGFWEYADPSTAPYKHSRIDGYWMPPDGFDNGPSYNYIDCELYGFGLAGFGGGGLVAQGTGGHHRFRNCIVVQHDAGPGKNHGGLCVAVDDSNGENPGQDPNDPTKFLAGEVPAVQSLDIEGCLFISQPGGLNTTPMLRVGSLRVGYQGEVLRKLRIAASGFYGERRTLSISGCPDVELTALNHPAIRFYAESRGYGYATPFEPLLHVPSEKMRGISTDFKGSTMIGPATPKVQASQS